MAEGDEIIIQDFLMQLRRNPSVAWDAAIMSRCIHAYTSMSKFERDWFDVQIHENASVKALFEQVFDDDILLDPSYRTESPLVQKVINGVQICCATGLTLQIDRSEAMIAEAASEWIGQRALIKSDAWALRILDVQTGLRLPCATFSDHLLNGLKVCSVPLSQIEASSESSKTSWYMWSAAATILVMIMAGIWWFRKPVELTTDKKHDPYIDTLVERKPILAEQPKSETPGRQTPKLNKEKILAAHFEPNPMLENFIGRTYRSEIRIEIAGPASGDTIHGPLVFAWKKSDPAIRIAINILNNRNTLIWEGDTIEEQLQYNGVLAPGLYYWIIKSGDTRLDVRKFYVPTQ